jgi:exodeoxyribonuclease-3
VKIATFNANSLRSRLPIVLKWLSKNSPDILCVQETKVQDVDFPREAFENTGYEYIFKGQKSYNGVAIFSKSKITKVEFGFKDEPRDEARLIKAVVQGISIVNTYVPQGYEPDSEKFQYKLQWFRRLRKYFAANFKAGGRVVWVGDLNIAPEAIDVYDPKGLLGHVCFHPGVHKELKKVMEWGFIDVFRMHCKEAKQYTFWDYRMNAFRRNAGWRLDHIMATQPMAKKSTACYIDLGPRLEEKPSDHTFLVAEFDL